MKNKIFLIGSIIIAFILIFGGTEIYAYNEQYAFPKNTEYSYSEEYEKYIGLYYRSEWVGGNPNINYSNSHLYEDMFKLNLTVNKSELDKWWTEEYTPDAGGMVRYDAYSIEKLEELYKMSNEYKKNEASEIEKKGGSKLFLEKGIMTIIDGENTITIPHYVICEKTNISRGGVTVIFTVKDYSNKNDINSAVQAIKKNYFTIRSANSSTGNSASDFWGDASIWFGQAQNSGYETPTQVNEIISIFEDMINVVGTTVIIVATIVLGIKYIIGTVESKTSAKEGLITLLVACVFFFGWTSIKNLLFPGNDFIFTSVTDTEYKDMVGRLFATFTYIAQFVVIGAIIYIGIRYIFAGADGRADLKGKSVYFIIGIILVFATTNVLTFISNIINEAF